MTDITNTSDIIDVRDLIQRVEELREETQGYENTEGDLEAHDQNIENLVELASLEALLDDLKGNGGDEQWEGDWYPITLIRDSHFTDAMQELCEDIGDFPNGVPSYYVIDWDATARNLQADYTSVEFDSVTYWYR